MLTWENYSGGKERRQLPIPSINLQEGLGLKERDWHLDILVIFQVGPPVL